ncbi:MAG: family 16 glycosylhydrolase [Acutalibacteraceae bacterium]
MSIARKITSLIISLLMIFIVPVTLTDAAEAEYDYVLIEDFEMSTVGTTVAKNKPITQYISTGWNGSSVISEDSLYTNAETGSTKSIKITNNTLSYSNKNNGGPAFLYINLDEELLKNSYGFRFWLSGDETVYSDVYLKYVATIGGVQETYLTEAGQQADGRWITVMWGDRDSAGLKWKHNGASSYGYGVPPRNTILGLSSLKIEVNAPVTANLDGQNFYVDDIQMIKQKNFVKTSSVINMKTGASIRLNNKNGIRFYTSVDTEKLSDLKSEGYTVELGTLISPADLLGTDELTFDIDKNKYINIPYNAKIFYDDSNIDFIGVVGSIVNIKESTDVNETSGNVARDFVGRGYLILKDSSGNIISTEYADYANGVVANNTRSLKSVALDLANDTDTQAQELYSSNKTLVDKWKNALVYHPKTREINGRKYIRTFYDDFEGTELDTTKWSYCPEWDRQDGGCQWSDSMTSLDGNGNLKLTCAMGVDSNGDTKPLCGAIRSRGLFEQKYGYFEIRTKLQSTTGFWSAFWLMPDNILGEGITGGIDGSEIDIFEAYSCTVDKKAVNHAVHFDGYSANHRSQGSSVDSLVYDGEYHTFALEWDETSYVFYIDGSETYRIIGGETLDSKGDPIDISQVETYLKITLEAGSWAGSIDETQLPDSILVDYVRVYQRADLVE